MAVQAGIAGNVVPDQAKLTLAHRFAPDTDLNQAEARIRQLIKPALKEGDTVKVVEQAPAAPPGGITTCSALWINYPGMPSRVGPMLPFFTNWGCRPSITVRVNRNWPTPAKSMSSFRLSRNGGSGWRQF